MTEAQGKTPIALITGYLGSGKTTLLQTILKETSRRLAVLMNEFGEIAIDSKIIQGKNVNIAELAGGCVCCSLIGEFEEAVKEIIDKVGPEIIVVETTGVAEPDALVFNIQDSLPDLRLDVVVTVADADAMIRFPRLGHIGRVQLEVADVILVNKTDLVDGSQLQQIENRIRKLNDMAIIFRTSYCQMDTNLLFGLELPADRHITLSDHFHGEVSYFQFHTDRIVDERKFEGFVQGLPKEIYRAKGFVTFQSGGYLFNFVAGRWDLEEMETDQTQLVFIGLEGTREIQDRVLEQLRKCEVA